MMAPATRRRLAMAALIVPLLLLGLSAPASVAQPAGSAQTPEPFPFSDRYPAEVVLTSPAGLAALVRLNVDIGDVRRQDGAGGVPRLGEPFVPLVATVYLNDAEVELLAAEGLTAVPIPNLSLRAWREYGPDQPSGWPTYDQWVARMQAVANSYPNLVRMVSIGTSVQGRQLWLLKITDNPDLDEDEPEFRWISTMHGNEPVGAELCLRMAELLTANYGLDPTLTQLVDELEIWLFPLFNPDGYMAGSRYNANGKDLNRNFPDRITDPNNTPYGRQPETQAEMAFSAAHHFIMGANYHTGALVVNYPWDSVPQPPDYAPDDAFFYYVSVGYSSRNSMIWNGGFPNGVTRGWEWYIIRGGLQDWAYYWYGEDHVTIEVSNGQPPPYSQMDTYWNTYNKDAMLWWMQQPLKGVRGLVTDALTGAPLDATVDVLESSRPIKTDPDAGDYHRPLLPGSYTVTCSAPGYVPQTWTVTVIDGPATVRDCALLPEGEPAHLNRTKINWAPAARPGYYKVVFSARVWDGLSAPVAGTTVYGTWTYPDGSTQDKTAVTDGLGRAKFAVKEPLGGTYTFCVTDISGNGYIYDPDANTTPECRSATVGP